MNDPWSLVFGLGSLERNQTFMQTIYEHVFGKVRPFASCHAATAVELADGGLLVAWFGGTEEGHPDTAIWGARRNGSGWSAPVRLAKVADVAHWNPVLFRAPTGTIQLFFKVGLHPTVWHTWATDSADDGATWSDLAELVPGDVGGRGPVKNRPIVLSDGAWLAPASRETSERWSAFVDRSDDSGKTWSASDQLLTHPSITGLGVIQPALWESRPGHVHMLTRSTGGWIGRSDSHDGGRTWAPITPTSLPNNNSGIDLARLADGRLVLACNPVKGNWAARTPLALLISDDNGLTWQRLRDLEMGAGEYSYPTVIPYGDGVAVVYTWQRERIACWLGPLDH
jgi:predicted neuraminidase